MDTDEKEEKKIEFVLPDPIIPPPLPSELVLILDNIYNNSEESSSEESSSEEIDEESEDDQDESDGMIFGRVFPYRRGLPVPEECKGIPSEPIYAECNICRVNMVDTITFPCHHAAMCVGCARDYGRVQNTCPMCRTPLQAIEKLYLSFTRYTPIARPPVPPINPRPTKRRKETDL